MPERIQRKRTKGWKMPRNTIYVGRPSPFGNPFPISEDYMVYPHIYRGDKIAVDAFRRWLRGEKVAVFNPDTNRHRQYLMKPPSHEQIKAALRGKNLACWCAKDKMCHADVLLEIANAD